MSKLDDAECDGIKVAKAFSDGVNSMAYRDIFMNGFVKEITQDHRTLQQGVMRGIYQLILAWAESGEKGWYDGRNEATVHFCQNIKALAEKDNVHFPFI